MGRGDEPGSDRKYHLDHRLPLLEEDEGAWEGIEAGRKLINGVDDNNQDKKLTIGELGKYVQVKVKEQAAIEGREQVPELQGDTEKVLVQW